MNENEISGWLKKQLRINIPVTDECAQNIATLFSYRKIHKGEYLLKEGQYCDWWGFVYKGLLRSYSFDNQNYEYTNSFFREGSFTCEFVSFYRATVSQTNVVALEDTTIFFVNQKTLDFLFKNFPDFEKFARLLYEKVLVNYKQHNLFRMRLNARERYINFLNNEPELIKRVPLKYIASYINVKDTSLSRIRRNMLQPYS